MPPLKLWWAPWSLKGRKSSALLNFSQSLKWQRQRPPLSLRHLVLICDLLSMRTTSRVCYMVSPLNITYENPGVPLITGRGEEGTLLLCGHCDQRDQLAEHVSTGKCFPFTAGTPGSFTIDNSRQCPAIPTTLHSPDTKYSIVSLPAGSPDSCPFLWYLPLHTDTLYFYKDRFLHWKNSIFTHYDFTWSGFQVSPIFHDLSQAVHDQSVNIEQKANKHNRERKTRDETTIGT